VKGGTEHSIRIPKDLRVGFQFFDHRIKPNTRSPNNHAASRLKVANHYVDLANTIGFPYVTFLFVCCKDVLKYRGERADFLISSKAIEAPPTVNGRE